MIPVKKNVPSYIQIMCELVATLDDLQGYVVNPDIRHRMKDRADLLRQIEIRDLEPERWKKEIEMAARLPNLS